jgi:hypothetical protein
MNWACPSCGSVNPAPKTQRAEIRCAACEATFSAEYTTATDVPPVIASTPHPVVIEKTSKRWKRQMVWGWSVMFLSVGGCTAAMAAVEANSPAQVIPFALGVIGFLTGAALHFSARAGAWWDNG